MALRRVCNLSVFPLLCPLLVFHTILIARYLISHHFTLFFSINCAATVADADSGGGSGDCSPVTLVYASAPFTLLPDLAPAGPAGPAPAPGPALGPYTRASLYASLAAIAVLLAAWARKQGWRWLWAEDAATR